MTKNEFFDKKTIWRRWRKGMVFSLLSVILGLLIALVSKLYIYLVGLVNPDFGVLLILIFSVSGLIFIPAINGNLVEFVDDLVK